MEFNMFYCGQGLWNPQEWLESTGSDLGGVKLMVDKANILPIYIENIYCGAANIIKQDMLSIGGEAAVHKYAINCKEEYGNVLVLGTIKHHKLLVKKLATQHWKLKTISTNLKIILDNIKSFQETVLHEVNQKEFSQLLSKALTVSATGQLTKDMAQLPLVKADAKQIVYLVLNTIDQFTVIKTYIAAIQSKGYQVLLEADNNEQYLLYKLCKPHYIYANPFIAK